MLAASDPMTIVLIVVALLGGGSLLLVFGIKYARKVRAMWTQFGFDHGLVGGPFKITQRPQLHGVIDDFPIDFHLHVIGYGKHRQVFTLADARLTHLDLPRGFVMVPEGFFQKVGKMFGGDDIETGDAQFDKRFIVKSTEPDAALALLDNERLRAWLVGMREAWSDVRIEGMVLRITARGMISKVEKLERALHDLLTVSGLIRETVGIRTTREELTRQTARAGRRVPPRPQQPSPRAAVPPVPAKAPRMAPPARRMTAPPAPPTAPPMAPPTAPPQPTSVPTPPAAPSVPLLLAEVMRELTSHELRLPERESYVATRKGMAVTGDITVERTELTGGFDLPDGYRFGRCIIGRVAGTSHPIAVRFPQTRNDQVGELTPGTTIEMTATIADWDEFNGRLMLNGS